MNISRRVFATIVALLAVGAIASYAATDSHASGLVVQTTAGFVRGVDAGTDLEWRGIPYAAPPLGNLRWRPPAPVVPWSGTRDATQFAQPCIQLASESSTFGSEDCLYLNVFVPEGTAPNANLPVMVHLHPGGNFFFFPYTDAGAFTSRGIIVVTLAYRLGVFGVMGDPALDAEGGGESGEYTALDQLAALHWVHDNIPAFGGDPGNVTLFGSSAGSFDTVNLVASPLSAGLITRAAVQGISFWPLTGTFDTQADFDGFGSFIADATGCSSAADVLACLRALPASTLVLTAGGGDSSSAPVGGSVLPEPPLQVFNERATVPLLLGFGREEDSPFFTDENGNLPTSYLQNDWIRDTNALVGSSFGNQARALYPLNSYDSRLWSYLTMRTDTVRGCPTRRLANAAVAHGPVWRYLYTHVYENDPFNAQLRAGHIMEDPLLWHSDLFGSGHFLTPGEEALSQRMTDYWTNFARTGNPNGPGLPSWPAYTAATEPTLTLDDQSVVITNYHDQECALVDTLPTPFPPPWQAGKGPTIVPPGFLVGHAQAP